MEEGGSEYHEIGRCWSDPIVEHAVRRRRRIAAPSRAGRCCEGVGDDRWRRDGRVLRWRAAGFRKRHITYVSINQMEEVLLVDWSSGVSLKRDEVKEYELFHSLHTEADLVIGASCHQPELCRAARYISSIMIRATRYHLRRPMCVRTYDNNIASNSICIRYVLPSLCFIKSGCYVHP